MDKVDVMDRVDGVEAVNDVIFDPARIAKFLTNPISYFKRVYDREVDELPANSCMVSKMYVRTGEFGANALRGRVTEKFGEFLW